MTEFLYHTFLYQFQLGNTELSFQRIKRFLSGALSEYQDEEYPMTAFYNLLQLGLIDYAGDNNYSLTKSCIYTDLKSGHNLGVNLPHSVLSCIVENKNSTLIGLTIFEDKNWLTAQNDLPVISFDLNLITDNFKDIRRITKKWNHLTKDNLGSFKSLEKYDYNKNKWVKTNVIEGEYSIYKKFSLNEFYFEYVFKLNDKFYIIPLEEYEKVRMAILANAHKSFIKFNQELGEVKLKPYFNYPNFLYKTLFITHVLNNGSFPNRLRFRISKKQFLSIVKPLKLNFEII